MPPPLGPEPVAAGSTAFLTKPIRQEVLLQAIRVHSIGAPPRAKPSDDRTSRARTPTNQRLAERVPMFLQNCRQNVIAMQQALEWGDLQTVAFIGHGLHGAGGMFGFPKISEIGIALEDAAERNDLAASHAWVATLSNFLDNAADEPV